MGPISLISTTIAPGDNVTATTTYTVASSDLPGPIVNTANVTGVDLTGEPVFATSNRVSVDLTYDASIEVIKTADRVSASPSETITYTYIINNVGNTAVDNVTLEDDRLGPISLISTTIAPGDNVTATTTYTVASSDLPGPIVNTANVTGVDLTGEPVFATSNRVSVNLTYDASIEVIKTADKAVASSQDTITYTYIITNIGNAIVDNVTLEDDKLGPIFLTSTTLAPGDNVTTTAQYNTTAGDLPGPIVNIATAEGQDPSGNTVTASDSESVELYPEEPGTRTLGYYKNHPCVIEQVLPVTIAGENITTAEQAISIMKDRSNHWSRLKSQLMVTILNTNVFMIGNCTLEHLGLEGSETVNEIISQAEALLAAPDASKDDLSAMQVLLDRINNSNTSEPLPEEISEACPPGGGPPKTPPGKYKKGFDNDVDADDDAMTKAEILKLKGVPGEGIDEAPGLQKPFNPKSRASERAGKKK